MITHILFDIDDTLMDYYTAEMNVTRGLFAETAWNVRRKSWMTAGK